MCLWCDSRDNVEDSGRPHSSTPSSMCTELEWLSLKHRMEQGWEEQGPKMVAHGSLFSVNRMKYLKLIFLQKRVLFSPNF